MAAFRKWKMFTRKFLFILVLTLGPAHSNTRQNVFTSVESIKSAMRTDEKIANYLRDNLQELGEQKSEAIQYIEERERMEQEINVVEGQNYKRIKTPEELLSKMAANPLHAFQTIRRLSMDIHQITNKLERTDPTEISKKLEELLLEQDISYTEDLLGAARGLLRLQEIYRLQASHLVHGQIGHIRTSSRLTIADCLLLGQTAREGKRMDIYVEWTEQAHALCAKDQNDHVTSDQGCQKIVGDLLTMAIMEHDESAHLKIRGHRFFPNEVKYKSASEQMAEICETFDPYENPFMENNLCYASGRLMSKMEEAQLFCNYLVRPDDPYVTLHRYKVEHQVSGFPHLMTIYDVISEAEADFIRDTASPMLERSTVVGTKDKNDREFSDFRISATAWLPDSTHENIEKISRRIQSITGLSTSGIDAEQFQVVNYGIGGMYNAHYDYIYKKRDVEAKYNETGFMGNRIITFILYLSDVELGGATAFPNVRTAVRPKKGAAAMWFNINDDMVPDERSFHGGCPVLYGSKWISNKWILEGGQLFRHPCPAKQLHTSDTWSIT